MRVTAEVTPHHLLLTDELVAQLRPGLQGQPAAADRGRRRGAARGAGRRHDRRRRHRPRPARRRGQGLRVGRGGHGDDRAGDGALGRRRPPWSTPACSTGPASPSGCRPRPPRIGRLAGHGRPLEAGSRPTSSWSTRRRGAWSTRARWRRRSRNTPYAGRELPGRVVATFLRGGRHGAGRRARRTGRRPGTAGRCARDPGRGRADPRGADPAGLARHVDGLAAQGRRRQTRELGLPPLPPTPDDPGAALTEDADGVYVSQHDRGRLARPDHRPRPRRAQRRDAWR